MRNRNGVRGVAGLVAVVALASACGGTGSRGDGDTGGSGADEEVTVLRTDADGRARWFDVAAGDDTAWLLVADEPAQVWKIASDGTMTRRGELAAGGDEIAAFGDGAAVTRFRCTDDNDDECGAPVADLLLLAPDGSVDHELTLAESDAGSLEAVGMRIVGASDEQVWVETTIADTELFAVSRSGDVETISTAHHRPFASDQICVVGGELLTVRLHSDLYDPEQGPPDTGVAIWPSTPIGTTVGFEAFAEGEWRTVAGSERTFHLRGDEARAVCDGETVRVEGAPAVAGLEHLARWTRPDGWVEPTGSAAPLPPGSVGVGGCGECAWAPGGEILRRNDDGAFDATGLVVADPDGTSDPPAATDVAFGPNGAGTACASFSGAASTVAPTATAPTMTVTAVAGRNTSRALRSDDSSLVCDR